MALNNHLTIKVHAASQHGRLGQPNAQLAASSAELAPTAISGGSAADCLSSHGITTNQHITELTGPSIRCPATDWPKPLVDRHGLVGETRNVGLTTGLLCQSKPQHPFQQPIKPILTALIAAKTANAAALPFSLKFRLLTWSRKKGKEHLF